ncbi:SAM-dependent methyltransferase [Sphingobacterium yanglingense]|uniref:PRMT5 arginine-N-methyltransferase domain-containing protein n=1 Tax=Sphingobacterium yanglingense TaxID=1437280 RepID=A0A4R6WIV3_9SPHI|nr:hypothetical protein [Sphingobacterium yanglingense]TDQ80173.1 hypothetical protein CLV99_1629 [Sphingobacterium yanglingense]
MNQKSQLQQLLKSYSDDILLDQLFHDKLAPAVLGLSEFLFELADIQQSDNQRTHLSTPSGNAIGPFWAASCSKELFRTQRFIKALHQAIGDKLQSVDGPIHVLYAGTGPFALLALPIMTQFSPEEVQFTLLEINPISFEKMNNCISELGLKDYINATHCVDAVKYKLNEKNIDILISETMCNGLYKEPQVSILLNLVSQLDQDCTIIPELIEVSLSEEDSSNSLSKIASLMSFDRKYIDDVILNSSPICWAFPEVFIQHTFNTTTKYFLTTDIQIYKNHTLTLNESSLNLPRRFHVTTENLNNPQSIQYKIGEIPEFRLA